MEIRDNITDKHSIDQLFKRSIDYRSSYEFFKFFNFIARFQHYSRFNTMLVYLQNENVTIFGSEAFWRKKFYRTVNENARPLIILAPKSPVILAYDIFDTSGEYSPEEFLEKGLGANPNVVLGKIDSADYNKAISEIQKWGIEILYKSLSYFKGGHITTIFSGKLEICLKENVSDEKNLATVLHELAHLFLGHTGHIELKHRELNKSITLPEARNLSLTVRELEAETVSFLISKKLGLETRSAEYIGTYITCEDDFINFDYELVIKVADKIDRLFLKEFYKSEIDYAILRTGVEKSSSSFLETGIVKINIGDFASAILDLDQAVTVNPANAAGYFYRGYAKFKLYQYNEALTDYTIALEIDPSNEHALISRGQIKLLLENYGDANIDFSDAININPEFSHGYFYRGLTKCLSGDHVNAILDFNHAIKIHPCSMDAYYARMYTNFKLHAFNDAFKDLEKIKDFFPASYYDNQIGDKLKLFGNMSEMLKSQNLEDAGNSAYNIKQSVEVDNANGNSSTMTKSQIWWLIAIIILSVALIVAIYS
jgi:tetratricopeptide (TPR) repeat protein